MNTIIGFISRLLPSRSEINKSPYIEQFPLEDEAISLYVNQILYKVCLERQQKAEQEVDEFLANLNSDVERYQKLHSSDDHIEKIEPAGWEVSETGLNNYVESIISKIRLELQDKIETHSQLDIEGETISEEVLEHSVQENIREETQTCNHETAVPVVGLTMEAGKGETISEEVLENSALENIREETQTCNHEAAVPVVGLTMEAGKDTNNRIKESSMSRDTVPESIKQLKERIAEKLKKYASSAESDHDDIVSDHQGPKPLLHTSKTKSPDHSKGKTNIQVIEEVLGFVGEALNKLNKQLTVADLNSAQRSESNETLKIEEPNQKIEHSNDGLSHHLKAVREEVHKIEKIEKNLLAAQSDAEQSKGDTQVKKKGRLELEAEEKTDVQSLPVPRIHTKHPSLETTSVTVDAKLGLENTRGQSDTVINPNSPTDLEIKKIDEVTEAKIKPSAAVEGREDKLNELPDTAGQPDIHLQKSMEKWLAKRKNVKPPEIPKYVFRKPKLKPNGLYRLPIWERPITPKVTGEDPSVGECHSATAAKGQRVTSSIRRIKSSSPSSVLSSGNAPRFKIVTGRKAKGDGVENTAVPEIGTKVGDKPETDDTKQGNANPYQTVDYSKQNSGAAKAETPKTKYSFVRVNYEMVPPIGLSSSSSDLECDDNREDCLAEKPVSELFPDSGPNHLVGTIDKSRNESQARKEINVDGITGECETLPSVQSSNTDLTVSAATSTTDQSHKKNLDKVNAILQRARTRKSRATHPFINKELSEITATKADKEESVVAESKTITRQFPKVAPKRSKLATEQSHTHSKTKRSQSLKETGPTYHTPTKSNPKQRPVLPVIKKVTERKTQIKIEEEDTEIDSVKSRKIEAVCVSTESIPKHPRINRTPEPTVETLSTAPSYPLKRSKIPVPIKAATIEIQTVKVSTKIPARTVSPPRKPECQSVCKVDRPTVGPCQTNPALVRGMSKHTARMAKKVAPVIKNTLEEKFQQRLKKEKNTKNVKKKTEADKSICEKKLSKKVDHNSVHFAEIIESTIELGPVVIEEKLDVIQEEETPKNSDAIVNWDELSNTDEEWEILTGEELEDEIIEADKFEWEIIDIEECLAAEREQAGTNKDNKAEIQSNEQSEAISSSSCYPDIDILQWLHDTEKEQRLHLRETVDRDSRRKTLQARRNLVQDSSLSTIDKDLTGVRKRLCGSNNNKSVSSATLASPFNEILDAGSLSDNIDMCCGNVDLTDVFGSGNLIQLYLEFQREYSRLFKNEVQKNPLLQMLIHCQQGQPIKMSQSGHPLQGMITITECESTNEISGDEAVCDLSGGTEIERKVDNIESKKGHSQESKNCISHDAENIGIGQDDGICVVGPEGAEDNMHGEFNCTEEVELKKSDGTSDCNADNISFDSENCDVISGIGHYLRPKHIFCEDDAISFDHIVLDHLEKCDTTSTEKERMESDVVGQTGIGIEDASDKQSCEGSGVGEKIQKRKKRRLRKLTRFLSCRKGTKEDTYRQKTTEVALSGLVERNTNCNANLSDKPVTHDHEKDGFEMAFSGKRSYHVVRIMQYQTMLWFLRQRRHG